MSVLVWVAAVSPIVLGFVAYFVADWVMRRMIDKSAQGKKG